MRIGMSVDSSAAEAAFARVEALAVDPSKPLLSSAVFMEQRLRQTFRDEADPWGNPWALLSSATLQQRTRRGNPRVSILLDTGRMYSTIRSGVEANEAFVSIGGTPDTFPEVHQFGNPSNRAWGGKIAPIPARAMLPITREDAPLPDSWAQGMFAPFDQAIAEAIA